MNNRIEIMKVILKAAAVYNILWGTFVIIFPQAYFQWADMEMLNHPMVWQGMGMVVGVYGLGYWWASEDPFRHWPIIAVGFLGKIFGPVGFFFNYFTGQVPFEFIYTLVTNDFIWWLPFGWMLLEIYKEHNKKPVIQTIEK